MKNWIWIVGLIAVATALGAQDFEEPKSVFSMLKIGQPASLIDHGATYSLSLVEGEVPLGHTVVEIGEDYVVVRDISGVKDVVVPVYSVKGIERVGFDAPADVRIMRSEINDWSELSFDRVQPVENETRADSGSVAKAR